MNPRKMINKSLESKPKRKKILILMIYISKILEITLINLLINLIKKSMT